jgi:hypothetical protein
VGWSERGRPARAQATQRWHRDPYQRRSLIATKLGCMSDFAPPAASPTERMPAQVERAVVARLGRLDQAARRLAQAVVVLGERGTGDY